MSENKKQFLVVRGCSPKKGVQVLKGEIIEEGDITQENKKKFLELGVIKEYVEPKE